MFETEDLPMALYDPKTRSANLESGTLKLRAQTPGDALNKLEFGFRNGPSPGFFLGSVCGLCSKESPLSENIAIQNFSFCGL
jgi:hypothetical protein